MINEDFELLPFRRALMGWYRSHHRKLPWRAEPGTLPDPYHVLVSEAMLQQTQVATVIDYFHRFLEAFPTVHDLAAAEEQRVLRLWQGLGYYRRARNLHAAAKKVVADWDGKVPVSVENLLKLPGIGRYTAGAIASIAHGQPAPILDGNVTRILARIFAIDHPTDASPTQKRLWALAEKLVPSCSEAGELGTPGDFNQAMMELGATVCTPQGPSCMFCPVRDFCAAFDQGRVEELPRRTPRRAPKTVTHHVLALEKGGKHLFQQRPESGLWAAMWQMPTAEALPETGIAADRLKSWAQDELGLEARDLAEVDRFTHLTTHRRIEFVLWRAASVGGRLKPGRGEWRRLNDLQTLPLSKPQQRVVAHLVRLPHAP